MHKSLRELAHWRGRCAWRRCPGWEGTQSQDPRIIINSSRTQTHAGWRQGGRKSSNEPRRPSTVLWMFPLKPFAPIVFLSWNPSFTSFQCWERKKKNPKLKELFLTPMFYSNPTTAYSEICVFLSVECGHGLTQSFLFLMSELEQMALLIKAGRSV